MRKIELLAPSGDKESLIAAIQNGADAVYLGGDSFNARASAKNFTDDELKWAVEYAHLREVKIYLTVNTLYKDEEFNRLIQYIDFLYDIQVDALIIQDLGLFYIVKNRYPDFEIHMSTQASVMNKFSAKYFEKEGAQRVVLARENTLEEIKEIIDYTNIEIEVFVHGALCVCYSGQCLMSSMIGKRSGNRGECAQPCRLQYQLKKDNETLNNKAFLLSPKDLNTIDKIGELIDAGVTSFKIEGRMKKPEYVGAVVNAYRKAIDAYIFSQKVNLENEKNQMMQMFNRDYTDGYIFHDKKISDCSFSGNRGIIIGEVLSYNKRKKRVLVRLSNNLKQGDSILFECIDKGRPVNKMYKNDKLISEGYRDDIIEIEFDYHVNKGNLRKIIDIQLIKSIQKTYDKEYKKILVDIDFKAKLNQSPKIKIFYNDVYAEVQSDYIVDKALKTPITKERIEKQLNKLGDTPFKANECTIDIDDDIIFPIKIINELRREAILKLSNLIQQQKIHNGMKQNIEINEKVNIEKKKEIDVFVSNMNQLKAAIQYPIRFIYYPYSKDALTAFHICQQNDIKFALFIPRIAKSKELLEIKNSEIYKKVSKVIVNEIGALKLFDDKEAIIGTGLNIYNSYSSQYLNKECILSLEMDRNQINHLYYDKKIVQVYGKTENMISEFCPISQHYFNKQVKKCNKCKEGQFFIIDRKNESFHVLMDEQCRMHLLNSLPLYYDDLNLLKASCLLLHFTDETKEMTDEVLNDYFTNIIYGQGSKIKKHLKYTNQYL